jgi:sorbitol-specific phosphotransferase system component IIBC
MPAPSSDTVVLEVTAQHGNAMLSRITAMLGSHDVDQFSYRVVDGDRVQVVIHVRGGEAQGRRVATRVRRLVGVLDVA